ncbi:iron-sulfur binding hydrogenase [Thermosipho affectus]|uniref:Iron-sulfur binding hydrogenase n=1 Tax=Thermosipho affectus TaxID=660294 RepID=A0ABX3IH94_9BACT|nr:DRTGG domain-containing protein [Thermosipho affectus]ONN27197.1 iron-sulfur binding hydrogenase [Thermosipho affectus]
MRLSEIIEKIGAREVFLRDDCEIIHAYTGDLLSMVMKNAESSSIWITVQNHLNIIAVAAMTGIKAILLCENLDFSDEVIEKAKEENICLLKIPDNAFVVSGKVYALGIR